MIDFKTRHKQNVETYNNLTNDYKNILYNWFYNLKHKDKMPYAHRSNINHIFFIELRTILYM